MNDNILYHALAARSPHPTARTPFRCYNAKAPEKGGAKKSRTMMSREWVKDTREALERAGQGERIDRRSLAERRDEAERAGDLEQAAEFSRKPNVHLGPLAYRAGDLEREGRGERSGFLAAGRAGGAGQSGASAGAGRPHRADHGEDRGDLSGASGAPVS